MNMKDIRKEYATAKVTASEKELIRRKADKCGLTVSDYMRKSALGARIHAALTTEEKNLLWQFVSRREVPMKFANALCGASLEVRMALFNDKATMLSWLDDANMVLDDCRNFIDNIKRRTR